MSYGTTAELTRHPIQQEPFFEANTWAVSTPVAKTTMEAEVELDFIDASAEPAVVFPSGIKIFFIESLLFFIFSAVFFVLAVLKSVPIHPFAAFGGILASTGICFIALLKAYEWKKLNAK